MLQFDKIAQAIAIYSAPDGHNLQVAQVADSVHMSVANFSLAFRRGVGVSPDRFSNYLRALRIDAELERVQRCRLRAVSAKLGLKSVSSIYDHSYKILAFSPEQLRSRGVGAQISYGSAMTPFGEAGIFSTEHGICRLSFNADIGEDLALMRARLPEAELQSEPLHAQSWAQKLFAARAQDIGLHLLGTNFQLSVWRALLAIPRQSVVAYGELAEFIGKPQAARAVGNAVGANPIAWLIPCHRVIKNSGALGGYHWGPARKESMLALELAVG